MTLTPRYRPAHARVAFTALASSALLAGVVVAPALTMSANAAVPPSVNSSHQRQLRADHRIVHRDARRDVLHFNIKSDTRKPAPRDRTTDITSTVVDHRAQQTVVQARARHLSRSDYRLMMAEILGADGRRYELVVDYSTKPIGSRISLTRFSSGKTVECRGASWSIKRSADRVGAVIPNSCLGDPAWVRVGVALVGAPRDLKTSWADDSRSRGRVNDDHLKLGPRQPRA